MITAICAKAKTIDQFEKLVGAAVIDLLEYRINEAIKAGEIETAIKLPPDVSIDKLKILCEMIGYQVEVQAGGVLHLSWGGFR